MSNQDQRGRSFWMALAIIFILSFLTAYAVADEPAPIPVEEDFFIGQIVNVNVGHWTTGDIVDYDSKNDLYKIKIWGFEKVAGSDFRYVDRTGKQISSRSKLSPKKRLEVLPDNPPIQNIKAEVEEIKPEFKFKKGEEVVPDFRSLPWADSVTTRIIDRAVLWGENVYRVERNRRRQPGDNGPGIWFEIISEKDLQFPEKKQPEYVEGLQP